LLELENKVAERDKKISELLTEIKTLKKVR